MMKKSQLFSPDAMIGMAIFVVILLSSQWLWQYSQTRISEKEIYNDLLRLTDTAALAVTRYSNSNLTMNATIGILDTRGYGVWNRGKIEGLDRATQAQYNLFKRHLGVIGPGYELQIRIFVFNGTDWVSRYNIGRPPSLNATQIITKERYGLIDSEWARMEVRVWV